MAFVTLGGSSQLQIKVPTAGSTDWADTMRTDTFLKIAQHDHTGGGSGTQITAGALASDSITGAKIRLDNDEYLKARNAANTANVNMLKLDTNDDLYIDAGISKLNLLNNIYLTARNAADAADVNLLKLNASDKLEVAAELGSVLKIGNNIAIQMRDQADSAYIDAIKVNTSDKIALGADLANLAIINNTYIQGRNAADSAYINLAKINASDLIELGATVTAATINTVNTSLIKPSTSAVTLTDNTAVATSAGVLTLSAGESATIEYKITRNSVLQSGRLCYNYTDTVPSETYSGTDLGVTFTVDTGVLKYTTTSTGFNATMNFIVMEK